MPDLYRVGLFVVRPGDVWPDDGVAMSKAEPDPHPWLCECGNVLGVMHRNSNRIMVLDAFRARITEETLRVAVTAFQNRDYSTKNLVLGDVPCAKCGRIHPWDASEQLLKDFLKRRKARILQMEALSGG